MMRRIKVLLAGSALVLGLPFAILAPVQAVDVIDPLCQDVRVDPKPAICKENDNIVKNKRDPLLGPDGVITAAVNILSLVIGILAIFIIIIFGGIRMITSGGNPNSVNESRDTIIYAAVGLIVAATAQAMVRFILMRIQ